MSEENTGTADWFAEHSDYFLIANDLANDVGEQNDLYAELIEDGQLTVEGFRDLTTEHLAAAQTSTFEILKEASEIAPYEELMRSELQLYTAIGEVTAKLASLKQSAVAVIHREKEAVAERIPELAPRLGELAAILEQGISPGKNELDLEQTALESELQSLTELHDKAAELLQIASNAWPIPRVISQGLPSTSNLFIVDEFPRESQIASTEDIAERVRRKYPEERLENASEFLALVLGEVPGRIYTLAELGIALYGESEDEQTRSIRVSALISNYTKGLVSIIGNILQDSGLVLQRGERRSYYRATGKQFGRYRTVFRAVPNKDADKQIRFVHDITDSVKLVNENWTTIRQE